MGTHIHLTQCSVPIAPSACTVADGLGCLQILTGVTVLIVLVVKQIPLPFLSWEQATHGIWLGKGVVYAIVKDTKVWPTVTTGTR